MFHFQYLSPSKMISFTRNTSPLHVQCLISFLYSASEPQRRIYQRNTHQGEIIQSEHQRIPLRIELFFSDTAVVVVIASLAVSLHPLSLSLSLRCNILRLSFIFLSPPPPPTVPPPPVNLMFSHFLFPHPLHSFHHPHHFLPLPF